MNAPIATCLWCGRRTRVQHDGHLRKHKPPATFDPYAFRKRRAWCPAWAYEHGERVAVPYGWIYEGGPS